MSPFLLSIVRTKVQVEERAIKKHERTKDFLRSIAFKCAFITNFEFFSRIRFDEAKKRFENGSNEGRLVSSYFQLCLYDRLNPNFRRKAIRLDGLV